MGAVRGRQPGLLTLPPPPVLAVDADRPAAGPLDRAITALLASGLIIYPTDTLYALGGRAVEATVAAAVRRAKGREEGKPLPLVAADVGQVRSLLSSRWSETADRLAARFWPGPLTLVVAAREDLPSEITSGTSTVAVRVPARELPRLLAAAAGPLISTSANVSGGPPPSTCAEAVAAVGESAVLALDGGPGSLEPSTIVDLTGPEPRLLREGAVPWAELLSHLR